MTLRIKGHNYNYYNSVFCLIQCRISISSTLDVRLSLFDVYRPIAHFIARFTSCFAPGSGCCNLAVLWLVAGQQMTACCLAALLQAASNRQIQLV
jgi:hypothetical protein